jgi:hypothetical protein
MNLPRLLTGLDIKYLSDSIATRREILAVRGKADTAHKAEPADIE